MPVNYEEAFKNAAICWVGVVIWFIIAVIFIEFAGELLLKDVQDFEQYLTTATLIFVLGIGIWLLGSLASFLKAIGDTIEIIIPSPPSRREFSSTSRPTGLRPTILRQTHAQDPEKQIEIKKMQIQIGQQIELLDKNNSDNITWIEWYKEKTREYREGNISDSTYSTQLKSFVAYLAKLNKDEK